MKHFISIILFFVGALPAKACDVCGCAPSSGGLGLLPGFQKHFVGLRYQYQSFYSRPHENDGKYQKSREQFHTIFFNGRWVVSPRFQFIALLPYKMQIRTTPALRISNYGIGDLILMVQAVLVNTASQEKKFRHLIQAGAGVKLPTGRFNQMQDGLVLNPNMQCGTGSWDFPIYLNHTVRWKAWGLYSDAQYTLNGTNAFQNRSGNRFQLASRFFYWKEGSGRSWMPQVGLQYEHTAYDLISGKLEEHTGGQSLQMLLGVDYYTSHLTYGLHLKQPLYQNLAQGFSKSSAQIALQCIYLFNKKPHKP